jgi:hypothetical protein
MTTPNWRRRVISGTALLSMMFPLGAVVSGPAAAACGGEYFYKVKASSTRMPFADVPHFKNGPGGTVTTTRKTSKSVSYGVVAGAESEVGAVLAKAKVSISASLTKSNSTDVINTYSRKISPGKFGHLRYVSWGKRVAWVKKKERLDCSTYVVRRGVIRFPTKAEGWYYWETNN